jgi:glucoamylase
LHVQPWYLTTTAVAEQLYDALTVWKQQGSLNVTSTSLAFFQSLYASAAVGSYKSTTTQYTSITTAVKNFADGFLAVVAQYTPTDGSLSEQYTRSAGTPTSASDLTWSYAAALTAFQARSGFVPASWGAKGLALPSSCQSGGGSPGSGTVAVTFNEYATTVYGGMSSRICARFSEKPTFDAENIYLTGSVDALKNWSPDNALLLPNPNYPTWSSEYRRGHTPPD